MLDQVLGAHGLFSDDVHRRESLIHGVNHSSLGEDLLFRHGGVLASVQPTAWSCAGKGEGQQLLVPMAGSHLQLIP